MEIKNNNKILMIGNWDELFSEINIINPKSRNHSLGIALNKITKTGIAIIQIRILVNRSNNIPPKFFAMA